MSDLDYAAVHTVHDCATGEATHTPLTPEELVEQADLAAKHGADQQATAEHRQALIDTVKSSTDPAITALVDLLGVA